MNYNSFPQNLPSKKMFDTIWMLTRAVEISQTPMWGSFNSKLNQEIITCKQIICYLMPIILTSTDTLVKVGTMK